MHVDESHNELKCLHEIKDNRISGFTKWNLKAMDLDELVSFRDLYKLNSQSTLRVNWNKDQHGIMRKSNRHNFPSINNV